MLQGDNPQEQVQALRSVNKNLPLDSAAPTSPSEVVHVETMIDPDTQREVVLWDDILQAFDNAVQVRHKTKVVPFLKGKDLRILDPRRIAAVPGIVLDVLVDNPLANRGITSPHDQQPKPFPVPSLVDESKIKVEIVSQYATPAPSVKSISSAPSTPTTPSSTTSTVRRNPVCGHEEAAMDKFSHNDKLPAFPSARGLHELSNDQSPTAEILYISPRTDSGNKTQQRGPQSTTTNKPVELDLAQTSISASHGDKNAQVALGDMYRDGKGVPKDYQAAMYWYLKAAEAGYADSQFRIGVAYDHGRGVPQDYAQAMEWYLKAANQGHAISQNNIGALYGDGRGVPQDYAQAMEWCLKAAEQGNATSQRNIGCYYHYGLGVTQDYTKAAEWYQKAANQGNAKAKIGLKVLKEKGFAIYN